MHGVQLHVGTFTKSLLIHLARDAGGFRRAGLDVRESPVSSSPAQFRSLDAGEFDLIFTSPDNVLAYRFLSQNPLGRNFPIEIIGAIDRGLGLSLCLAPSITAVGNVRGKAVGVDVPQSGFAFVAYALLDRAGLGPGDYTVEALGSTPRRASGLIEGSCAATVLNAGSELRAEGFGCTIVSSVADIGPYLGIVIAAKAADDPVIDDTRRRFADVLLETSREILAREREAEVIEATMSLLSLTETQAQAHYACLLAPAVDSSLMGSWTERPSPRCSNYGVGTCQHPNSTRSRTRSRAWSSIKRWSSSSLRRRGEGGTRQPVSNAGRERLRRL